MCRVRDIAWNCFFRNLARENVFEIIVAGVYKVSFICSHFTQRRRYNRRSKTRSLDIILLASRESFHFTFQARSSEQDIEYALPVVGYAMTAHSSVGGVAWGRFAGAMAWRTKSAATIASEFSIRRRRRFRWRVVYLFVATLKYLHNMTLCHIVFFFFLIFLSFSPSGARS